MSERATTAVSTRFATLLVVLAAASAAAANWPPAPPIAAPTAGVESGVLPRSILADPQGRDAWQVTFRFRPEIEVKQVALVGSFNDWDRQRTRLAGPNSDGEWSAQLTLETGVYQYKFLLDDDVWRADPANTDQSPDGFGGYNSFLRLGRFAQLSASDGKLGDGRIDIAALLHSPNERLYVQPISATEVSLRYRTLTSDVKEVSFVRKGEAPQAMKAVVVGPLFTFWETRVQFQPPSPTQRREPPSLDYTFIVDDGAGPASDVYTYHYTHVARAAMEVPEWTRHAIWYQIMPDRFRNGDTANDPPRTRPWTSEWFAPSPWEGKDGQTFYRFFAFNRVYGGDFAGMKQRLAYLKELGVNALYLTPIFEAPSYHKYDLMTYVHVDDDLGVAGEFTKSTLNEDLLDPATWSFNASDRAFLDFLKAAHDMGFKVILDAVFNHAGSDHPAFKDVQQVGRQSRFADWFDVTGWQPFAYTGWAGFAHMPVFAKDANGFASPSLKKHLFAVTQRWMDPDGDGDPSDGVDGWRLDVPNDIPRAFWSEWRQLVKKINPDAFITGEVWNRADQWLDGDHFDAVMNYEFARTAVAWIFDRKSKIGPTLAAARLDELRLAYPQAATFALQNLVDSHDTDRLASMAFNPDREYDRQNRVQDNNPDYNQSKPDAAAYQRARLAVLFQMTYLGAPLLYYGDEAGMWGADDPSCRKPMLWHDLAPYEQPEENAVMADQLQFYKKAIALRASHAALRVGQLRTLLTDDAADVWVFLRSHESEHILVALNASGQPREVQVSLPSDAPAAWTGRFGAEGAVRAAESKLTLKIPAAAGVVYVAAP